MSGEKWDVVIVGGGPAGLTAGIYACRQGRKTLLVERTAVGGQVNLTHEVWNYPGFEKISGMDLMKKFQAHAKATGLTVKYDEIIKIESKGKEKLVKGKKNEFVAKAVIVATGSAPKHLWAKGEKEFANKGVHYCASCDGPLYKDKTVVVIGGGNSAITEALFLANLCKSVKILHRRDELTAEKALQDRATAKKNIEYVWNTEVVEFRGKDRLESVLAKNNKTNEESTIVAEGAFIYVGTAPNTAILELEKDEIGMIITGQTGATSEKGIFAAGDCIKKPLRQIATCVGEGAVAATSASHHIEHMG